MAEQARLTGAWVLLLLAALLTGILAGGVLWPAPLLDALLGKAAWFFPLYLLALSLYAFISGSVLKSLARSLPLCLLLPTALFLLHAGDPKLAGSLGQTLARPLVSLAGDSSIWLGGFILLALFVFVFVRSLLILQQNTSPIRQRQPMRSGGDRVLYPGYASDALEHVQSSQAIPAFTPGEASREQAETTPLRRSEEGYRFTTGISRRDLLKAFKKQASESGETPPMVTILDEEAAAAWYASQTASVMNPDENTPVPEPAMERTSHGDGSLVRDGFPREISPANTEIPVEPGPSGKSSPFIEPDSTNAEIPDLQEPVSKPSDEPCDRAHPNTPPTESEPLAVYHDVAPSIMDAPREEVLRTDSAFVPRRDRSEYRKPDASLLVKSHERIDEDTRAQMQATAEALEKTFFEFGIEARVTNICRGPVITQYEMSVPPGIRLSRVVALQDNIALNLAAASVRIEAPIPGKSAIGIEVPNRKRSMVTLRDILESPEFQNATARIPLALGQMVSGAPMVADLAAMPHLIIAGTTGSGKSVCVNSIICSILYNMRPSQVRFILVDPKYVEMAPYNGIPHLLIPVINKPRAAILALKWLVKEMEERYQCLQSLNARNIDSYNEKLAADPEAINRETGQPLDRMPYLVLVIDELADLMLLAAKEIEDSISRLAAMSRAVGIHLIFATQRPSVDVLTGVIKNNFPARIAFQVASTIDSRTILDTKGADKLLGKGDSLFVGPGSPAALRVQGAFLSEAEVEKTADYLRSLGTPLYRMEILDEPDDRSDEDGDDFMAEDDPLYNEAIQIVIQTQRASASYVQRRLKVGYNRAARMIERMESEGIIGQQTGSKPRDVLVTHWP
ncbi:MAG TPA: DNA translocase FtsK [Spirochaetota bacterium]|nr:DNA translocase FtsK [Spirochaetota bacterium]HPN82122.1 DNA translocase FtsK [Spirochaetota bacterium]